MGSRWQLMTSARVTAYAAWMVAGVLLVAGWAVIIANPDDWGVGVMLAATAAMACAVAAVAQVRIYMARVCSLIQRLGVDDGESTNVRMLH